MLLKAAAVADFGNWRTGIAQQRSRLIQPDRVRYSLKLCRLTF